MTERKKATRLTRKELEKLKNIQEAQNKIVESVILPNERKKYKKKVKLVKDNLDLPPELTNLAVSYIEPPPESVKAFKQKKLNEEMQRGKGKSNPWIVHVKSYQKKYGVSYKEAMKMAKKSYRPKSS